MYAARFSDVKMPMRFMKLPRATNGNSNYVGNSSQKYSHEEINQKESSQEVSNPLKNWMDVALHQIAE